MQVLLMNKTVCSVQSRQTSPEKRAMTSTLSDAFKHVFKDLTEEIKKQDTRKKLSIKSVKKKNRNRW